MSPLSPREKQQVRDAAAPVNAEPAAGRQPMPILDSTKVIRGRVTRLNRTRGFGFLRADGDELNEYFFHFSALDGGADMFAELTGDDFVTGRKGDPVQFRAMGTEQGPRAIRVEALERDDS